MPDDPKPPRRPDSAFEERRSEALKRLETDFHAHRMSGEEYAERVAVARNAEDETELSAILPASPPAPAPTPSAPTRERYATDEDEDDVGFVFAVMGGSVRKGRWEPPARLYSLSLMGGVELDFCEADLLEGTSEVIVFACMGGVKILVPDDIDVEVNGVGLMGGFDHVSRHEPGDDRPLLRIKGLALMGGVEIKVKSPPGPSTADRIRRKLRDLV